ncbi:MAG: redoxin domain-containing protein, partial [Verrucomicrobiota bacterium]
MMPPIMSFCSWRWAGWIGLFLGVGTLSASQGLDPLRWMDERVAATPYSVICFLGTECPMARQAVPQLLEMASEFEAEGVQFLGVFSNAQDSEEMVESMVRELEMTIAVVRDPEQRVADRFAAIRTPEVRLVKRAGAEVLYQGRIDDQFSPGVKRRAPSRNDLRMALEETMAGQPVTVSK